MSAIEVQAARTVTDVISRLASHVGQVRQRTRLQETARALIPTDAAARLLGELSDSEQVRLGEYLASPDLEYIAVQLAVAELSRATSWQEDNYAVVREQLSHGLRNTVGLREGLLFGITDVVFDIMIVAVKRTCNEINLHGGPDRASLSTAGHLTAMATRNSQLLAGLSAQVEYQTLARTLRGQIALQHSRIRLPHTGTSRSVAWYQLYVAPRIETFGSGEERAWETFTAPAQHTVVLGDPGSGKSTLAAKLTHDVASSATTEAVPFLVVLRDLSESVRRGSGSLTDHIVRICRDSYDVDASRAAIQYLLLNGRAVVVLDGLDELTDVSLRTRFIQLVEGFVVRYPLVPVVVTSRRIGYAEAALDPAVFGTCLLAPFDAARVSEYTANWFALDDSATPVERGRLRSAFMQDSASIEDLRRNPLLLALLCAMYGSERHIPRNRAQVYERCAVMVFERWDSMRGIRMPLQFHGHVRGAVQYLAWTMFSSSDTQYLPKGRILRLLTGYLRAKQYDSDLTDSMARDFLEFCAGRAWVLTEVGANDAEPIYGFAHRTFLEYFSAEYLVRHHPTPAAVWPSLKDKVGNGEWEVVAQLALQLLDRNVDGGAEALLDLALTDAAAAAGTSRWEWSGFAGRATAHLNLSPASLSGLCRDALASCLDFDFDRRFRCWFDAGTIAALQLADSALSALLYDSLVSNVPQIARCLPGLLAGALDRGVRSAPQLIAYLTQGYSGAYNRLGTWREPLEGLRRTHSSHLEAWRTEDPLSLLHVSPDDRRIFDRLIASADPADLYKAGMILGQVQQPIILRLLTGDRHPGLHPAAPEARALRDRLIARDGAWIPNAPAGRTGDDPTCWRMASVDRLTNVIWPAAGESLGTFLVLSLPYLELGITGLSATADLFAQGRHGAAHVHPYLFRLDLPPSVESYLLRWIRHEVSVVGTAP